MKIYLATDHAGFELKEIIKLFLEIEKDELKDEMEKSLGLLISEIEIVDFGAYKFEAGDNYVQYIGAAAGEISREIYMGEKNNFAIIFGGSGEGEAIVADKYLGVRAGVINSENIEIVKLLREHNDANILSIGARFISKDFAKIAVRKFLNTKFIGKESGVETRHQKRVAEITELEEAINTQNIELRQEELNGLKELQKIQKQALRH